MSDRDQKEPLSFEEQNAIAAAAGVAMGAVTGQAATPKAVTDATKLAVDVGTSVGAGLRNGQGVVGSLGAGASTGAQAIGGTLLAVKSGAVAAAPYAIPVVAVGLAAYGIYWLLKK